MTNNKPPKGDPWAVVFLRFFDVRRVTFTVLPTVLQGHSDAAVVRHLKAV